MRSHGAPNWPDPNSQGQFVKTKTNTADFHAPASAYRACLHLLPNGGELTAAQQQIISPLMLKLAGCMRSHGITNFPDPTVNANGVTVDPHGLNTSSAVPRCAAGLPEVPDRGGEVHAAWVSGGSIASVVVYRLPEA